MNRNILLIGGGGHCKSVLSSLLDSGIEEYSKIGIIDAKDKLGEFIMGIPIIGCDEDLPELYKTGYNYAFVTVGSVGNPSLRIKLFNYVEEIGFSIPTIIDSSAVVSKYSRINEGVFVGKQAVINTGTNINRGAIINTGSIIEHDCKIGEFVHIAPGTVLSGEVSIGDYSHIGSNATIKQLVTVGSNSIIGIGSVVTNDIEPSVLAYGNPCKEVKKL